MLMLIARLYPNRPNLRQTEGITQRVDAAVREHRNLDAVGILDKASRQTRNGNMAGG